MRVLEFEDSAGAEHGEGGRDNERGVSEAGEEGAAMDVIKLLGVVPFFFCVGDFEAAVRWDAGYLLALCFERGDGRCTKLVG